MIGVERKCRNCEWFEPTSDAEWFVGSQVVDPGDCRALPTVTRVHTEHWCGMFKLAIVDAEIVEDDGS